MANYIEKNTVEILRCSNWAMRALHDNLYEIIHSEKFDTHTQNTLNDLLERIDQNVYGAGCVVVDIMDFCGSEKNKIPLVLFYGLIEKTIKKIATQDFGDFKEPYLILLNAFKNKIL